MSLDPSAFIPTIEVRTALTPKIRVSTSGAQGGGPGLFLKLLKPTVVGRDANDSPLFQVSPYGATPEGPQGMLIFAGIVFGVLAVAFIAGRVSA